MSEDPTDRRERVTREMYDAILEVAQRNKLDEDLEIPLGFIAHRIHAKAMSAFWSLAEYEQTKAFYSPLPKIGEVNGLKP